MSNVQGDAFLGMVLGRCLAKIYYQLKEDPQLADTRELYQNLKTDDMRDFWILFRRLAQGDDRDSTSQDDTPYPPSPRPLASFGLLVAEASGDKAVWLEELHHHYNYPLMDDATRIFAYHMTLLCRGEVPKTSLFIEKLNFPNTKTFQGEGGLKAVVLTIALCVAALNSTSPNFVKLLGFALNSPGVKAANPADRVWLIGALGCALGAQIKASALMTNPELTTHIDKIRSVAGINLVATVAKLGFGGEGIQGLSGSSQENWGHSGLGQKGPEFSSSSTLAPAAPWAEIPPPVGFNFEIANLICGRFSGQYRQFLSGEAMCSAISNKISNSMIRVAATRIFADPYQSIVELPVNSIDSYRRMRALASGKPAPASVGKFGMGFFSFLYWLIGHTDRWVEINSFPQGQTPFALRIHEKGGSLASRFIPVDPTLNRPHGTDVALYGRFTPEDQASFMAQLRRLDFVKDVTPHRRGKSKDNTYVATVTHQKIGVGDWAEGITIPVLFGSALIPSISTKGLSAASQGRTPADFVDESGFRQSTLGGFVITVGDIAVVHIQSSTNSDPLDTIVVTLPINTPLPVSRDDVVIDSVSSSTADHLRRGFWHIIIQLIRNGKATALNDFFTYLGLYKFYSNQPALTSIIDRTRQRVFEIPKLVIVPSPELATILKKEWSGESVAYLPDAPLMRSYRQINQILDQKRTSFDGRKIFKDVQLVPLNAQKLDPTDGGLPGYIFVNADLLRNPGFKSSVVASYAGAILRNYDDPETSLPRELFVVIHSVLDDRFKGFVNYDEILSTSALDGLITVPEIRDSLASLLDIIEAKYNSFGPNLKLAAISKTASYVYRYYQNAGRAYERLWADRYDNESVKSPLINIFIVCLAAIAEFNKYADNIEQSLEYISQIRRLLANFQTIVPTYGTVVVTISMLSYPFSPLPVLSKYTYVDKKVGTVLSDSNFKTQMRDAFFRSLSNNIDERRRLKIPRIDLIDERLFPAKMFLELSSLIAAGLQGADDYWLDILRDVMLSSRNPFEAYLVYDILANIMNGVIVGFKKLVELYVRPDTIQYIQTEMRHRYSPSFYDNWLSERPMVHQFGKNTYLEKYKIIFFNPMILAAKIFVTTIGQNPHQGPPRSPDIARIDYRFSANQLIDYVFWSKTDQVRTRPQLLQLLTQVQGHQLHTQKGRPQFQSVSIAVNEGTTKGFIPSVLTEQAQNSVDAIRAALAAGLSPNEFIDVIFQTNPDNSGVLSFRDYIGIPDAALLSLWIPFLSSKTSEELISTGEMGTGFFNVYRQPWSRKVEIITRDLHIEARPILEGGRVVDIGYGVTIVPQQFQGTQINIHLRPMTREELIAFIVDLNVFINTSLAFLPYPVRLNDRTIHADRVLVYQNSVGSVYRITGTNAPSILLTNAIPMGELIPYLTAMYGGPIVNYDLYMNIIIDINKTYYLPVQSRNRLAKHQNQQTENALKNFITNGLYRVILDGIWRLIRQYEKHRSPPNAIESFLPGATSYAPVKQLLPYRGGGRIFTTAGNYLDEVMPDFGNGSFMRVSSGLGSVITRIGRDLQHNSPEEIDAAMDAMGIPRSEQAYRAIIQFWFEGKPVGGGSNGSGDGGKSKPIDSNQSTEHRQAAETGEFFNKFAQVYYQIGATLGFDPKVINFQRPAPKIEFVDKMSMGTLAHYMPLHHKIQISFEMFTGAKQQAFNQSWARFVDLYKNKSPEAAIVHFRISAPLKEMIGNVNPSSLLIHELQHALYQSDHGAADNPHGFRTIEYEGQTQNLEFDQATNLVFTAILANGFWDRLMHA